MTHQRGISAASDEIGRRSFLRWSIGTGSAALAASGLLGTLLSACSDPGDPTKKVEIDLSTDIGVLNFVYAVTQLEYDFYNRVVNNKFPGILAAEVSSFTSFQGALSNARADLAATQIPSHRITDAVLFRLGQVVDFANRSSVFSNGQIIEDAAAGSFLAAQALLTVPDKATVVGGLATAAASRANTLRGSVVAPTPHSPVNAMATLMPYYLTTFTITNG